MNSFEIKLPCRIHLNHGNYFNLNMNNYRNAHYHVLNKAKVHYAEYVKWQLWAKKCLDFRANKINISYEFIPANHRRIDTLNFIAIVDKFFLDALVDVGLIKDDSYKYIEYEKLIVCDVDKQNDYHMVECIVESIA